MFSYSVIMQKNCEVFKILYIIINALGATFYDINTSTLKYFTTLHSCMVFSFYVAQVLLCIFFILPQWNFSAPFAAVCVYKFCETVIPILVIVQSYFSGRSYLNSCIDDIIFTDKLLHNTGIEVAYVKMKQIVQLTFISTSVYVSFVLITSFSFIIYTGKRFGVLITIGMCILESSNVLYNIYLNYFFCLILIIFKHRFKQLNEQIQCLTGPKHEEGVSFITVKPYNQDGSNLEKIKTVKFVHAIYRQIVLAHMNRFGFVVQLQFTQIVTVLIFCSYYLLSMLMINEHLRDFIVIGIVVVTMLRGSLLIMSIIVSCEVTSSEANQMEKLVHELMSETKDGEVFKELENFSVELIHAKVEFTANDFFTIDYCLITTMVGSIVSYVIIFLQLGGTNVSNYGGFFDDTINQTISGSY